RMTVPRVVGSWDDAGDGCRSSVFVEAEDGIRARDVTGVQTCALPISYWFSKLAWCISNMSCNLKVRSADDQRARARTTWVGAVRSEERRVGKECRSRWSRRHSYV